MKGIFITKNEELGVFLYFVSFVKTRCSKSSFDKRKIWCYLFCVVFFLDKNCVRMSVNFQSQVASKKSNTSHKAQRYKT